LLGFPLLNSIGRFTIDGDRLIFGADASTVEFKNVPEQFGGFDRVRNPKR
jgi:hypothetical protein